MGNNRSSRRDMPLTLISLTIIFLSVGGLAAFPAQSIAGAEQVLYWCTTIFASPVLLFAFLASLFVIGLAFSKYGKIRLGEGAPDYSTLSWIFMFILSGLGSSSLYWGFLDWAYYYQTPGLNLTPESQQALKFSVAYSFFHSGLSAWAIYAVGAVAMCYHFHVRKNKGLGLASVIEAVTGCRANGPVGRLIDLLFMLCMFGALTISLVLTATTFSRLLATLTGIPDTFATQVIIILAVSVLFTLSSWVGMDGGMKRLSHMVCWGVVALTLYIYLVGPTQFITSNTLSSLGLMLTNFVDMSLFTDPMGNGKFTREWTVFYWLWWISYAPGVALFVTRVSRGRTIREVIMAMLVGGCVGVWFVFGVLENYSLHNFMTGVVNVPGVLSHQGGELAISMLLDQLPAGRIVMTFFLFVMAIFLAAHMDAVGYAVSATCTRDLAEGEDPAPSDRLFWCIMLTLVPLAMIFSRAPLNTMKTAVIVTAIPFLVVLLLKAYGLLKWLREDYGHVPGHLIEERHSPADTVTANKQPVA
ncbi:BCCT family transporter [Paraburkholderia sp. J63]|uniref:BCCT family transporter n=1 Tax=Paraburkholderia sp. J63 TaxID=2805434 RepID=UPI002ABE5DEA|nr:BCCT family transporter [Paraburkholderia sp. J63]